MFTLTSVLLFGWDIFIRIRLEHFASKDPTPDIPNDITCEHHLFKSDLESLSAIIWFITTFLAT